MRRAGSASGDEAQPKSCCIPVDTDYVSCPGPPSACSLRLEDTVLGSAPPGIFEVGLIWEPSCVNVRSLPSLLSIFSPYLRTKQPLLATSPIPTMTQYRYTPLSGARQIRLLELHAGAKTDQLSVDLIHISLDKTPFFVALSYPWGSPQPRKAIRCSDLCAEIGPSLHSALQHLRKPDRALFVWADALCINQEDIPERTQQVRMMGDIYAAAGMTAIWLGEESDEAKLAHGWLRRFDRIASEFESDSLESDESSFIDTYQDEKILDAAFGKNRKAAFKSIWALLDRPWFTRKWVIQELVKSRRPLLIIGSLPPLPLAGIGKLGELCRRLPNEESNFHERLPSVPCSGCEHRRGAGNAIA